MYGSLIQFTLPPNTPALTRDAHLPYSERSETGKCKESLLSALLCVHTHSVLSTTSMFTYVLIIYLKTLR